MDSVFSAPMSFFDSTPVGRILTRASSDLFTLDFDVPYSIVFFLAGFVEVLSIIIIMATVTWQVLVVAFPVLIIVAYLQKYYLSSARELVRINGTTKAPVMNYATESYLGVVTIRAFEKIERFFGNNLKLIDIDATLFFHTVAAMEWVLIRVELLQNLTIITSTLFLVLVPQGSISPERYLLFDWKPKPEALSRERVSSFSLLRTMARMSPQVMSKFLALAVEIVAAGRRSSDDG